MSIVKLQISVSEDGCSGWNPGSDRRGQVKRRGGCEQSGMPVGTPHKGKMGEGKEAVAGLLSGAS